MFKLYKTDINSNKIIQTDKIEKGVWINITDPSDSEIKDITTKLNISDQLLRYPLDIAEKAHIDIEDENVLIVVDVPITEIKDNKKIYVTMPLGILVIRDEIIVTISKVNIIAIDSILNTNLRNKSQIFFTEYKSRFVLQILFKIAGEYIKYMSYISSDVEEFENHMEKTMRTKELMSLLQFEKTMIYFNASIKANQTVLQKIARGKVLKLYEEDEEILEDTLIENTQAIEMIQTYSEILNGIIDIFGTMVSNNVNVVMKFLTSITIIIAIPTMIASFLGMNLNFPFSTTINGFYIVMLLCVITTLIAYFWLKKRDML